MVEQTELAAYPELASSLDPLTESIDQAAVLCSAAETIVTEGGKPTTLNALPAIGTPWAHEIKSNGRVVHRAHRELRRIIKYNEW